MLLVLGLAAVGFLLVLSRQLGNLAFASSTSDDNADLPPGSGSAPDVPYVGPVGKLSAADIARYASDAGFEGDDLVKAVAIALAESGGKPTAVGDLTIVKPHGSIGLWQVNTNAHPEFDWTLLTDPAYNAEAAFAIYAAAGRSFRPWSTFKNNAYVAHLNDAFGAVNG